jgi:hypothetical protein
MNHKESAAKHTPEPWKIEDHYHYKVNIIEENDPIDRVIASLGHFPEDIDYPADIAIANSRRLVACVNACAGIPTEALECQTKKELTKKLIDTNKELLAALEEMEREYGKLHDGLSDMLGDEEGEQRLFEEAIPDDYQWLVGRLVDLVGVANRCNETIKKAKEVFNDL